MISLRCITSVVVLAIQPHVATAKFVQPPPDRADGEGEGPIQRQIIRGAIVIDGTGAPPRGPVDIVIEGNRIERIVGVGTPGIPIDSDGRPGGATREIDAEGMYVLPWPSDMNYANEQHRFGQVARQWNMIHPQGSEEWDAMLQELLELDVILDPTMTAYLASRDVMRARTAEWHERYTLPSLWDFYEPSRENHGSFYYDWTSHDEIAWKNFYRVWMDMLDDYKDLGGRVTVSSDAGFIYNLFGFSTIEEMELLQEAGFHPLEVIRGATMHGAQALFDPKGQLPDFGIVREGMLADLIISPENPVNNLKVLYGIGHERLNPETGLKERIGGVKYTIKDGIVYDAKQLLEDVARMVEQQKRRRAATPDGG